MQSANSWILVWRYRVLADEALAYARILKDPSQRRIFEELAARYLKLAAGSLSEVALVTV